ncbi:MAG: restriction endonuclease subunit S [Alcaligenaceae bacterium]|nr:MAG: restriction endonuclease subunit S [Alcaligenaceae bacterium]
MTLPTYGEYTYSGVEWLGSAPSHWRIAPLWTLFRRTKRTGFQDDQLLSVYRDYGVVPKASRDDNNNKPSDDLSLYQLVEPGDLAINKMKAWQGSVAISDYRGIVSPAYFVYGATHSEDARFLHYLLRSPRYITGYLSISKGIRVNQWDLEPQYHSRMPVLLPDKKEQTAIAAFLDRETAKIDALIAEQEKLIDLLAEKRQATISHAVIRGLDPDAPMKDSGVAWLGEMPAHWATRPLKSVSRIGNGSTPNRDNSLYWDDDGFPWLNSSVVNQDEVFEAERFVTPLALKECHLPIVIPPALLVGITGQGKTRGMATRLAFTATINQHVAYVKPDEKVLGEKYLLRVLESAYEHLRTESDAAGSTKGAITCEQLGQLKLPFPDLNEQMQIAAFLDRESGKLDALAGDAERATMLLKERRAALIAAAVTGKVDVRATVAQTEEVA